MPADSPSSTQNHPVCASSRSSDEAATRPVRRMATPLGEVDQAAARARHGGRGSRTAASSGRATGRTADCTGGNTTSAMGTEGSPGPPRWRQLAPAPVVRAAAGYLVAAPLLLAPSILPGRTLVPADAITHYTPFRQQAGGFEADNPLVADAATQFYPWLHDVAGELRDRRIPEWTGMIAGGVPETPNGYVSLYYPPTWLAAVLDPFDAYNLFVLLHVVLGALGVYVLGRAVGARPVAAWITGLLALAAGAWLHWSLHLVHLTAMVGLPWAMVAARRAVVRPGPAAAAALAAVLGLWWIGGNPQYLYDGCLVLAGWTLALLSWPPRRRGLAAPLATLAVGVVA